MGKAVIGKDALLIYHMTEVYDKNTTSTKYARDICLSIHEHLYHHAEIRI